MVYVLLHIVSQLLAKFLVYLICKYPLLNDRSFFAEDLPSSLLFLTSTLIPNGKIPSPSFSLVPLVTSLAHALIISHLNCCSGLLVGGLALICPMYYCQNGISEAPF